MTTLQDAARKSFEAWKKTGSCFYLSRNNAPGSDLDGYQDAYTQGQWIAWQAALAQQGEQQPVAWYEYNQDLDAWFLAYGHNPKAKTRPLVFGDTAAPAPQPAQQVPATCVWTKDSDFEMGDTYDSSCGEKWSFIDGGPTENRVSFCQGCGKPVKLVQDTL